MSKYVAGLLVAGRLAACSCGAYPKPPACELAPKSATVFLGTVSDDNDDGRGPSISDVLYLVRVEEVYSGLPETTSHVFVDPASVSSCSATFVKGTRYLFFAGKTGKVPAKSMYAGMPQELPYPARWQDKRHFPLIHQHLCSGTRDSRFIADDLHYLRARGKGSQGTRIFGRRQANWSGNLLAILPGRVPVVSGAEVTATNAAGGNWKTLSDELGRSEFAGLPAGSYRLRAAKAPCEALDPVETTLADGGCAQRELGLR
jgi:hypothetical protein